MTLFFKKSAGDLHRTQGVGKQHADVTVGTFNISNCVNNRISTTGYSIGGNANLIFLGNGWGKLSYGEKIFQPKTYTILYTRNAPKITAKKVTKGVRQPGDKYMHFDTKTTIVNETDKFPIIDFEFHHNKKFITYIEISINVSIQQQQNGTFI